MVNRGIYSRDLYKINDETELYNRFYSMGKKVHRDERDIINQGFLDR
jgi:hypothetical protein